MDARSFTSSLTLVFAVLCSFSAILILVTGNCLAVEPRYSLDELANHPYRFPPVYGHAAQIPGSPKYFVPGYGYRIPGFGFRAGYSETLNPYADYYRFGRRVPQLYSGTEQRYWDNSQGGPWYYPGAPNNTHTAWPNW